MIMSEDRVRKTHLLKSNLGHFSQTKYQNEGKTLPYNIVKIDEAQCVEEVQPGKICSLKCHLCHLSANVISENDMTLLYICTRHMFTQFKSPISCDHENCRQMMMMTTTKQQQTNMIA